MEKIRVRFAPSPTGFLHIGGARTALYNWLFARRNNGTFILRIEDTDEVRSTPESVQGILDGMKWLGLDWDEGPEICGDECNASKGNYGPYYQMQRRDIYKKYVDELILKGKAYYCYCSQEELAQRREEALKNGKPPKYDERCRNLTDAQKKEYESQGRKPVVRFRNDEQGDTSFDDIVRGQVTFKNEVLDDFIIVKSSGVPVYNFAVSVDDYTMKITHIIRGDDHLSNTPRQLLLYKAFGWDIPKFAHIPMILGSDGSRLSKRHGATSVTAYRDEGYLPEALINYLSLLGWSTEDSQQLFSLDELIHKFSLERCSSSPSIFDPQKLLWISGEYIRAKSSDEFFGLAKPWLIKANLVDEQKLKTDEERIKKIVLLEQEKVKLLTEIPGLVDFMIQNNIVYDEKAVEKVLKKSGAKNILLGMREKIQNLQSFTAETLEEITREYAVSANIKTGQVFHPLRVATSGRTQGPSLFHYLEVLGKDVVLKRIDDALPLCTEE